MEKSAHTPLGHILRERLLEMRKQAGLTQRELARRLDREHSLVARVEDGERRLDLVEFIWYAKACGQKPSEVGAAIIRELEQADARKKGKKK